MGCKYILNTQNSQFPKFTVWLWEWLHLRNNRYSWTFSPLKHYCQSQCSQRLGLYSQNWSCHWTIDSISSTWHVIILTISGSRFGAMRSNCVLKCCLQTCSSSWRSADCESSRFTHSSCAEHVSGASATDLPLSIQAYFCDPRFPPRAGKILGLKKKFFSFLVV